MNTPNAAQAAGVSVHQVDRWCRLGIIATNVGGRGRGDTRWWTEREVACLRLAAELLHAGVDHTKTTEAVAIALPMPSWEDQLLVVGHDVTDWHLEQAPEGIYWSGTNITQIANLDRIAHRRHERTA